MRICLTHIHEEAEIARVLKKWIESTFAGQCEVLLIGDPADILFSSDWIENNDQALEDSEALIIICSPVSVQKPWIHFQAGCAWAKKISTFLVCHSGAPTTEPPKPLFLFPAFDLNEVDFPLSLFSKLAQKLDVDQVPRILYGKIREEIQKAQSSVQPTDVQPAKAADQGRGREQRMEAIYEQILQVLATDSTAGFTSRVLADHFRTEEQKITNFLNKLVKHKYVYASPPGMGHINYHLTAKGRTYLEDSHLI